MRGETRLEDPVVAALTGAVRTFDLGRPMFVGMPQSSDHVAYRMAIPRRHGDLVRPDGSSGASELIITGGHVGTHIDGLAHISYEGHLHGGIDAQAACIGGRYGFHGMETVDPIVGRGLLLDVATCLGVERCEAGYEVTPEDLATALRSTGIQPAPGDVLLVRTGWGTLWDSDPVAFAGEVDGAPGPGEEGARWLADFQPRAVGSDTVAFERIAGGPGYGLPGHRLLIVERGIHIIEMLDLELLAAERVHEFGFVLSALPLVGATGSPVRPLALVSAAEGSDG